MNRSLKTILMLLVTISLGGCLLLSAVQLTAFDIGLYEKAYDKHGLQQTTGLSKANYTSLCENILVYLNGQRDYLYNRAVAFGSTQRLFNQKELQHMEDVKHLFVRGYWIRNISFVTLILCIFVAIHLSGGNKGTVGKLLLLGPAILFFVTFVIWFLLQRNFYRYFTVFHEIFFTNDLWLLNPETDLLINMFPLEFFNDMALQIMLYFTVQLAAIASIGYFISKTEKNIPGE